MSRDDEFGPRRPRQFDLGGIPPDQIRRIVTLASIALVVVLILSLVQTMFYRIEASDEGVVLRFGKQIATVPPGLHGKFPWPVDQVYKVPVQRIQTLEFGFETTQPGRRTEYAQSADDLEVAEMLTGDLNLGHVEWIVQYRVKDPKDFLFKMGDPENAASGFLSTNADANPAVTDTILDISESVMRKLVGDSSIDSVLTLGRERLAKDAQVLIQEELDGFEAGVDIVTVKLQTTAPPTAAVQEAFQAVNRARQKKEKVVNEALGERNSIIPAARGERDKAIAEAEGYASRVELETKGQVNSFLAQLAEYEKAPDVTRRRLYLEAMEEILSQAGSTTIIDESVRGVLPVLNLDEAVAPAVSRQGARR